MAYNILELNEKLTTELRALAKEMGIKRPDAYKKEDLIYKILDEQAIMKTKNMGPEPKAKPNNNNNRNRKQAEPRKDRQENAVKPVVTNDQKLYTSNADNVNIRTDNSASSSTKTNNEMKEDKASKEEVIVLSHPDIIPDSSLIIVKEERKEVETPKDQPIIEPEVKIEDKTVVETKVEDKPTPTPTPTKPTQLVFRSSRQRERDKSAKVPPATLPLVVAEDSSDVKPSYSS